MLNDNQRKAIFAQIEAEKKIKEEQLKMTRKLGELIDESIVQ